jgi:hypothetical protein
MSRNIIIVQWLCLCLVFKFRPTLRQFFVPKLYPIFVFRVCHGTRTSSPLLPPTKSLAWRLRYSEHKPLHICCCVLWDVICEHPIRIVCRRGRKTLGIKGSSRTKIKACFLGNFSFSGFLLLYSTIQIIFITTVNIGTVFFADVRAKVLQVMTERVCHCFSIPIPPSQFLKSIFIF